MRSQRVIPITGRFSPQATPPATLWRRRIGWLIAFTALLGVVGLAIWLNHQAEQGLAAVEQELAYVVEADHWTAQGARTKTLPVSSHAALPVASLARAIPKTSAELIHLTADTAVVRVVLSSAHQPTPYRQTQVFRTSPSGWVRIAPSSAVWGSPRSLETTHFRFDYHALDEAAVHAAAAKLDSLYPALWITAISGPPSAKLHIKVDPSFAPGQPRRKADHLTPSHPWVTASPATYLAPITWTDGDLLAQAVVLEILDDIATAWLQADFMHDPAGEFPGVTQHSWHGLVHAVRLWQVWEQDLPLAHWRRQMVQWLLVEALTAITLGDESALTELCAHHQLWRHSFAILDDPLACGFLPQGHSAASQSSGGTSLDLAHLHPQPLYVSHDGDGVVSTMPNTTSVARTTVALATVIEYAAATYGVDTIPQLLLQAYQHQSWETLVPAVFGVDLPTFEAGWLAHLAGEYSTSPAIPPR